MNVTYRSQRKVRSSRTDCSVPETLEVALVRYNDEEFLAFRENGQNWRRYFRLDELEGDVHVIHLM